MESESVMRCTFICFPTWEFRPLRGFYFLSAGFMTMAVSGFIGCIVYLMGGLNRPAPFMREVSHGEG